MVSFCIVAETLIHIPERQWNDIQQQHVGSIGRGSLAREDASLDSCSVCNSLVRVDALLELLAIEEVAKKLLNLWNTSRT